MDKIIVGVSNFYKNLSKNNYLFKTSNIDIGANLLKPFNELYNQGLERDIIFSTLDQYESGLKPAIIICIDNHLDDDVDLVEFKDVPLYLITFEPPIIKPDNWSVESHSKYKKIFTWCDNFIDNEKYFKYNFSFAQADVRLPINPWTDRKKLITLINSAKMVNGEGELYSLRLRFIQWFEAYNPTEFDFYGVGWNPVDFKCYKGTVTDKISTLQQYKFCICFENYTGNYLGYVSEKIFDCFIAGVVPIYYGAQNIKNLIPNDCFIDFRNFSTFNDAYDYITNMSENRWLEYMAAIWDFCNSKAADHYSISYNNELILDSIKNDFGKT